MPEACIEIAEILKDVRDRALPGKVALVVGDGIDPQLAIKPRPRYIEYARSQGITINTIFDEDRQCWRYYETERWSSWNIKPALAYYYAWRLCFEELIHCIITTNYDLWFESMLHKDPLRQGFTLNPVASDTEYLYEGFYEQQSQILNKMQLFKAHGSLNFASFIDSAHPEPLIFKLPQFLVGFPRSKPRDEFALPAHNYLGCELATSGIVHPSFIIDRCDRLAHFIDFNFPRSVYSRVINSSFDVLDSADVNLVLVIGFSGFYDTSDSTNPFNEELVPVLLDIANSVPVYQLLNTNQNPTQSYLYNELQSKRNCRAFQETARNFLVDLMRHLSQLIAGDETLSREWLEYYEENWVSGNLFLPPR